MTVGGSKNATIAEDDDDDAVLTVEGHEVAVAAMGSNTGRRRLNSIQSYVGKAVIEQRDELEDIIRPVPTSNTEYWSYCIFCKQVYLLSKMSLKSRHRLRHSRSRYVVVSLHVHS